MLVAPFWYSTPTRVRLSISVGRLSSRLMSKALKSLLLVPLLMVMVNSTGSPSS
ncbi:hypothetical protein D3C78_1785340 [compost metagenome]